MKLHNLTDTELATVLMALRVLQEETDQEYRQADCHFDDLTAPTDEEIDDLCERLNCAYIVQLKESGT